MLDKCRLDNLCEEAIKLSVNSCGFVSVVKGDSEKLKLTGFTYVHFCTCAELEEHLTDIYTGTFEVLFVFKRGVMC
jgi:hypothetical protein